MADKIPFYDNKASFMDRVKVNLLGQEDPRKAKPQTWNKLAAQASNPAEAEIASQTMQPQAPAEQVPAPVEAAPSGQVPAPQAVSPASLAELQRLAPSSPWARMRLRQLGVTK